MINALIAAKADINFKDRWGAAAMDEAVKHGHEAVIGVLRAAGGALGKEPARLAGALCSLVYAGDTAAIKLYVMAGAPLDAGDYDKRVALHIAAAEGAVAEIEILLAAGADPAVLDRWGATPLDEAKREKRARTVTLLQAAMKGG